jgi:predicted acetyltransferase
MSIYYHSMEYRIATDGDLDLLAEWNHQLIRDEGHRNPMTVPELRERMGGWLKGEYKAVVFSLELKSVAYALYKESESEVYLRQLFVARGSRRQGIGRSAIEILRSRLWPCEKRLTVEVLIANKPAVAFWRSVGYRDYCLTLEIVPGKKEGRHDIKKCYRQFAVTA